MQSSFVLLHPRVEGFPRSCNPHRGPERRTGQRAGRYYCTAVYRGDAPSGTPLNAHYGAFTGEPGLYEYLHYYHFDSDLAVGTYTIVYFTAVLDGNTLKPIEGSAFASNLYVSLYPATQSGSTTPPAPGRIPSRNATDF